MQADGFTYTGGSVDDPETLDRAPAELRSILEQVNGFVAYGGGFHLRGACRAPDWHSLGDAWTGTMALHKLYESVHSDDVPFGEDAVGDQWLLRAGRVIQLLTETGDIEHLDVDLGGFLAAVDESPIEKLGLHPLMQFQADGGVLEPGHLLNVYPPFCTAESASGVSLAPVPVLERRQFLAELAGQMPDTGQFRIEFE